MASVKVSERVEASADAVWGLVRDFGGVQRYSKEIQSCSVEGEGVGAVRTLSLGALTLQERLEVFDDARRRLSYSIVAGPLPLSDYLATIQVSEDGDACRVEWSSTFEPKGIAEAQAQGMVEGIYRSGLAGIRKALGA
jgi:carbon monoxide dehydrogenase subunit G